jgi:hypothetical protein
VDHSEFNLGRPASYVQFTFPVVLPPGPSSPHLSQWVRTRILLLPHAPHLYSNAPNPPGSFLHHADRSIAGPRRSDRGSGRLGRTIQWSDHFGS